jgi:hypothetical protein
MYEHATNLDIRFTVGTRTTGLTYYSPRDNLKQLSSKMKESGNLETPTKTKEPSADDYHLEPSYLTWLEKETQHCWRHGRFQDDPDRYALPFFNRNPDWTISLMSGWLMYRFLCHSENSFDELRSSSSLFPQLTAMSAAAFAYGGLHLLAWNAPFHAPIFGLLWKISGITTASLVLLPLLIVVILLVIRSADGPDKEYRQYLAVVVTALLCIGILFFALLYVFARVYLVVESFLSLAYLPKSALTTPNFSLYFPHIG